MVISRGSTEQLLFSWLSLFSDYSTWNINYLYKNIKESNFYQNELRRIQVVQTALLSVLNRSHLDQPSPSETNYHPNGPCPLSLQNRLPGHGWRMYPEPRTPWDQGNAFGSCYQLIRSWFWCFCLYSWASQPTPISSGLLCLWVAAVLTLI